MQVVLIADSSQSTRALLHEWISDADVEFAESSSHAIKCVRKQKIDVVLLDYDLFKHNDENIIETIKNIDPKVFIIGMSFFAHKTEDFLRMGVDDFLQKPFDEQIFAKRLKNWLKLANLRRNESLKGGAKGKNAFGVGIWERRVIFDILSERSLALLWEYFLNDARFRDLPKSTEWMRACYDVCAELFDGDSGISVALEENDRYFFLTITGLPKKNALYENLVECARLDKYRFVGHSYKRQKGVFTLFLRKESEAIAPLIIEVKRSDEVKHIEPPIDKTEEVAQEEIEAQTPMVAKQMCAKEYLSTLIFEPYEKSDILQSIQEAISTDLYHMELESNAEKMPNIGGNFIKYGHVLVTLEEFKNIGFALIESGQILTGAPKKTLEKSKSALYTAIKLNVNLLSHWCNEIFIKASASDIHALDEAIITRLDTIKEGLKG